MSKHMYRTTRGKYFTNYEPGDPKAKAIGPMHIESVYFTK